MIWETRERKAMLLMGFGAMFYAGWIASAAHFNISQRWVEQKQLVAVQTKLVPKLKTDLKQAACDKFHLAAVATQAITAAQVNGIPSPGYEDIEGCAPVTPVKAPKAEDVVKK